MLVRKELKRTELFDLLSVCALSTKQINLLLHLKKEAQQFKHYSLIKREKVQTFGVGRPIYYMYTLPNQFSVASLKRGELLEKFVLYAKELSWLFSDFKAISESTLSVTIFDRERMKQYNHVYLQFITNTDFKANKFLVGKKNIYLCEDGSIGKRIDLHTHDLYFSLENGELKAIMRKESGYSATSSSLTSVSFKQLDDYFTSVRGDFTEALHEVFKTK